MCCDNIYPKIQCLFIFILNSILCRHIVIECCIIIELEAGLLSFIGIQPQIWLNNLSESPCLCLSIIWTPIEYDIKSPYAITMSDTLSRENQDSGSVIMIQVTRSCVSSQSSPRVKTNYTFKFEHQPDAHHSPATCLSGLHNEFINVKLSYLNSWRIQMIMFRVRDPASIQWFNIF